MSIRSIPSILAIVALVMPVPQAPAVARDGAIAAGIIGAAIGSAILMQGQRGYSQHRSYRRTVRARAPQKAREARNTKDPFASASAPADYARPVSASAR